MISDKKSILVVEDHASIRYLLKALLSKQFSVVTAKDGLEGLIWMDNGNLPDIILLDVGMPRIDGIEFIENLKVSGYYHDIPIIIISGNHEKDMASCKRLGVNDFLNKPFNPIVLRERINSILN